MKVPVLTVEVRPVVQTVVPEPVEMGVRVVMYEVMVVVTGYVLVRTVVEVYVVIGFEEGVGLPVHEPLLPELALLMELALL